MTNEILITLFSLAVIYGVIYLGSKSYVNSKIMELVPYGVEFADKLTENTNKEKLVKAISFVEIGVLSVTPAPIKPLIDYLIDSEAIAIKIERYITAKKVSKYKRDKEDK